MPTMPVRKPCRSTEGFVSLPGYYALCSASKGKWEQNNYSLSSTDCGQNVNDALDLARHTRNVACSIKPAHCLDIAPFKRGAFLAFNRR